MDLNFFYTGIQLYTAMLLVVHDHYNKSITILGVM